MAEAGEDVHGAATAAIPDTATAADGADRGAAGADAGADGTDVKKELLIASC